jgi:transposase
MKKSLFEFASENFEDKNHKKEDEKVDENASKSCDEKKVEELENEMDEDTKADAKNLYEKYKNYSKDDLIREFLSSSRQKIKDGTLSKEKIENTLAKVAPYMNENQKKFFEQLLSRIDE